MRRVLITTCFVAACTAAAPEPQPGPAPTLPPPTAQASVTPDPAPTTKPPAPPAEEGTLLQRLMKSHFKQVATIRSAVIAGNINDAIAPARTIVDMQGVDTLPEVWRTSVKELQAASVRIKQAPDLAEAAAATADIGMTCAGCHIESGGPSPKDTPPPPKGTTVAERMQRHLWSTEKLWEGLYVPSDEAWESGANALASEPLPKDVLAPGGVHARHFATTLVSLGKKAQGAKDGEARAKIYASLLSTCSPCHGAVRKK